jgi:hypothetical protein
MNIQLSPAAWIGLSCILIVVLLSTATLWSAWNRSRSPLKSSPPPRDQQGPSFTRTWKKEEAQLAELAERVKELKKEP